MPIPLSPFVAVLIALLGALPAPAQEAASASSDSAAYDGAAIEKEAFGFVNDYRKANDLPPLRWDATIAQVARDHSRDMATGVVDFGHAGFHDRVAKLTAALAGFRGAGENVFETDDPVGVAENAVAVWLKSPHHLHNIRGDFNYSGLGVWKDKDGVIYFTQIFLKLDPSAQTAQAAPAPPGATTPFGLLATPGTR